MELYVVRHGETNYNKAGKVQGRGIDAPINETGRDQAAKFFRKFESIEFDHIYTSTLQRTWQSVDQFIKKKGTFEKLSGLDEIDWGAKEGLPFSTSDHNEYLKMTESWKSGQLDYRIDGGESPIDVRNRQREAFKVILGKGGERLLICMHGRAMRILLSDLINYDLRYMDLFTHANLCLYKVIFTGNMFRIQVFDGREHLE
jgi:probable phosphoglycerate mutase